MSSSLLIVKTGTTVREIGTQWGDFEQMIADGMGALKLPLDVCRVDMDQPLPPPDAPAGIVVTGSPVMVSERLPWSERTAAWLVDAVGAGIPVLGICYGHQLLAHALGGEVGANPRGREIGTVHFRVAEAADNDELLGGMPETTRLQATHVEAVLRPPANAVVLGATDLDPCSAFRVDSQPAWGLQTHPEFPAGVTRAYIQARREVLLKEGLDADAVQAAVVDSPSGSRILQRFRRVCEARIPTLANVS